MTTKNVKAPGDGGGFFKAAIALVLTAAVILIIIFTLNYNNRDEAWPKLDRNAPKGITASRTIEGDDQGDYITFTTNKDAKHILSVFSDPRCPYCEKFEKTHQENIEKLVAEGKISLRVHMMDFLDENFGGDYSARSVAALNELVKNDSPEVAWKFYNSLWLNHQNGHVLVPDLPSNEDLARAADRLGASDSSIAAIKALDTKDVEHMNKSNTDALNASVGSRGVPAIFVNGIHQENALDASFLDEILEDNVPEDALTVDGADHKHLLKLGQGDDGLNPEVDIQE